MARASFRRRPDGIHEIVRRGRLAAAAVVAGTVALGMALLATMAAAAAVYLAVGLPLVVAGGLLVGMRWFRHARRPHATPARSPDGRPALRAIDGGRRIARPPTAPGEAARRAAHGAGAGSTAS